ncbi:condensation domain-containing protein, partial [Baffinella frigidus]
MVPSAFVVLEQLPLTPNGKVDRKGLPSPDMSLQQKSYVAPTTETEKLLCEIWQEVLGLERIGITDNFFALGGHSLLVMKIISTVQQQGFSLTAKEFFSAAVLSDLAYQLTMNSVNVLPAFIVPENLIPDDCLAITPEMLPLISLTQTDIEDIAKKVPGGMVNIQDIYPLGPLQEGILFTHLLSDGNDPYILSSALTISSKVMLDDFLSVLQLMVNRHDVLRTAIIQEGLESPAQVVCRHAELPVQWLTVKDDATAEMSVLAEGKQRMDLTQAPLLQVKVMAAQDASLYHVLLQFHHVISDHVALEVIQEEFSHHLAGTFDSLPAPLPYRNFIAHTLQQASTHDASDYFTHYLDGVDEPTLPFDLSDIQGDGSRIVELREHVPAGVATQIRDLSRSLQLSPASIFHSAFGLVVAACSGREDVVFGTVMSGRLQGVDGGERMLGVFINTLPVRLAAAGRSVIDLVRQTQEVLRDLLPFEQTPLALAQRCSGLSNSGPLFSAMLNYRHNMSEVKPDIDEEVEVASIEGKVDASVDIDRVMAYMQTALVRLVDCLMSCPDKP